MVYDKYMFRHQYMAEHIFSIYHDQKIASIGRKKRENQWQNPIYNFVAGKQSELLSLIFNYLHMQSLEYMQYPYLCTLKP